MIACIGPQYQAHLTYETEDFLEQLKQPLTRAALIHMELRSRTWQVEIAGNAIEQLSVCVIVINDHDRVVDINPAPIDIPESRRRMAIRSAAHAVAGTSARRPVI